MTNVRRTLSGMDPVYRDYGTFLGNVYRSSDTNRNHGTKFVKGTVINGG